MNVMTGAAIGMLLVACSDVGGDFAAQVGPDPGAAPKPAPTSFPGAGSADPNCAAWPREQLFPILGPFHYGPGQGPCLVSRHSVESGDEHWYLSYEQTRVSTGRIVSASDERFLSFEFDGTRLFRTKLQDAAGHLLDQTEFNYGAQSDKVLETHVGTLGVGNATIAHSLDALGYVVDSTTFAATGEALGSSKYYYQGCKLSRRRDFDSAVSPAAASQASKERVFEYFYDGDGRLTAQISEGLSYNFVYDCSGISAAP